MPKETKKTLRSKCCVLGANFRSGQLLVEMLVALGILTVGFLGVTTLLSRALGLNRVVADNYTATYLAMEGIEITKNILDANVLKASTAGWNDGFRDGKFEVDFESRSITKYDLVGTDSVQPLTFDSETHVYGYGQTGTTIATPFRRTITIKLGQGSMEQQEVTVNSQVDWTTRGGGTFSVNLEDHFFHWR